VARNKVIAVSWVDATAWTASVLWFGTCWSDTEPVDVTVAPWALSRATRALSLPPRAPLITDASATDAVDWVMG
jgi:hypothetical protein